MNKELETIIVRALNNSRNLHPPTYLGIRLLADSFPNNDESLWINSFIDRKVRVRKRWRYHYFSGVKKIESDIDIQYRKFMIGSPLTVLVEAYLLRVLSESPHFQPHSAAYSYLWPKSKKSGRSHEYYSLGYEKRNRKVSQILRDNPDYNALIFDIKNFYPSVSQTELEQRLAKRLNNLHPQEYREPIRTFINDLLEQTPQGIPIGPEMGHMIGHIALEDVDKELYKVFGERYLRYVDDIILVCDREEEKTAPSILESILKNTNMGNLELNETKTHTVNSETWLNHIPTFDGSFGTLVQSFSIYLMFNPDEFRDLRSTFQNEGFSLPFQRIMTLSKYNRYAAYIHSMLKYRKNGFKWLVRTIRSSKDDLLNLAQNTKKSLIQEYESLAEITLPKDGIERKWLIQKYKYYINRMLYLISPSEYSELEDKIPKTEEFNETAVLISAFKTNNINNIVKLPGRIVQAFSELWSETQSGSPGFNWDGEITPPMIDSLATLSIYRVINIPDSVLTTLNTEQRTLLQFCSGIKNDDSNISSLSYLDELKTLFAGVDRKNLHNFTASRFSDTEDMLLETLRLGSGYFSR